MKLVPVVKFKKLAHYAQIPSYATPEAAGMDVRSTVYAVIPPGGRAKIETGLAVEIPPGWELQVRGRSGLAVKHGVTVLNSPGTIDSDYRGEIGVVLVNDGDTDFIVNTGDRIAQLVLSKAPQGLIVEVEELGKTDRGESGFGSTGVT